jgi:glutamate racemase
VVPQACPGLVELIEAGELDGPRLSALLERLTLPLRAAEVDAVVLGCTHYPFVGAALRAVLGDGVELIDSAPAIARRTQSLLDQSGLRAGGATGTLRLLTTGDPAALAASARRLAGQPFTVERLAL